MSIEGRPIIVPVLLSSSEALKFGKFGTKKGGVRPKEENEENFAA